MFWLDPLDPAPSEANAELKSLAAVGGLDPRAVRSLDDLVAAIEALGFRSVEVEASDAERIWLSWENSLGGTVTVSATLSKGMDEGQKVAGLLAAARSDHASLKADMEEIGWTDLREDAIKEQLAHAFSGPMTPETLAATKDRTVAWLMEAIEEVRKL